MNKSECSTQEINHNLLKEKFFLDYDKLNSGV